MAEKKKNRKRKEIGVELAFGLFMGVPCGPFTVGESLGIIGMLIVSLICSAFFSMVLISGNE
ncbi:MAG: hypothetical protein ABIH51_01975 [Patescibacteria group bacterium]